MPPPPPPRSRKKVWIAVVAIVAVALVAVVVLAAALSTSPAPSSPSNGGNGNPPPPPAPVVFASSGTVWQIQANHYEALGPGSWSQTDALSGSFTATNGITAYVMDSSQYQSFSSSGSASSYYWTSGQVSSGGINSNIGAGTYYVVFENPNSFTTTSVQVTQTIQAVAG